MSNETAKILPVHLAYRGFEIGLPESFIYKCIDRGLQEGIISRPQFRTWPGGDPIVVDITPETLLRWKAHYADGVIVEIPENVRADVDRALRLTMLSQ